MVRNHSRLLYPIVLLDISSCLQDVIAYFFRILYSRIDGRNDSNEDPLFRLEVSSDDLQHPRAIRLPSQCDIKIPRMELEQAWQQLSVIYIRAVGRIPVRPRASVNSDLPTLFLGKTNRARDCLAR